jgi:hypothetical protein
MPRLYMMMMMMMMMAGRKAKGKQLNLRSLPASF